MTQSSSSWSWPGNARAAVSLTYDDGNDNNLEQAMPDLEAAGLRGTFYLAINRRDMQQRAASWRAAYQRGHEIGNHSVHHNCRADGYAVRPAWIVRPLEDYTERDMADEIATAAAWLDEHIGVDADRTYAYPCGHTAIGRPPDDAAYIRAVATRHFAARGAGGVTCDVPPEVDLFRLAGCCFGTDNRLANFTAAIDHTLAKGGCTSLIFHGIGGPSHETSRDVHRQVIAYLKARPVWVAPVSHVARHLADHQPRRDEPVEREAL